MNDSKDFDRGSGNVFRDLQLDNADLLQLKAVLAAEIMRSMDEQRLTGKDAQGLTGVMEADFSRIRRGKLDRFTVDRLMTILDRLGNIVTVHVDVRRQEPGDARAATAA